jgi:hypothetical protein
MWMEAVRVTGKHTKKMAKDGKCIESKSRVDFSLYCSLVS